MVNVIFSKKSLSKNPDSTHSFENVDFWGEKGYKFSQKGDFEGGVDYYLKGICIDPDNFKISYNLGCLYTSLNKLKAALYWFAKAHSINTADARPILGVSLIMLRMKNYTDCLEFSMSAADLELKDEELKINLLYLNALSCKKLSLTKKASFAYSSLHKIIYKHECKDAIRYTWGLLLAPIMKDRKIIERNVESLQALMNFHNLPACKDIISRYYDYSKKTFINKDYALNQLSTMKFFKFFTREELSSLFLPHIKLNQYSKNQVVF